MRSRIPRMTRRKTRVRRKRSEKRGRIGGGRKLGDVRRRRRNEERRQGKSEVRGGYRKKQAEDGVEI